MATLLARLDSPLFVGRSGVKITLIGSGTSWTAGTPGTPAFAVSAGSKTAQAVTDGATATLTYTAPTTPGVVTITDPGTGATAKITVRPLVRYTPSLRRPPRR